MRFRIGWPRENLPNWSIGVLLADIVVKPVLGSYKEKIPLWRFHRRAARDAAGHQFSFLFYTDPSVAAAIFDEIMKNRVLEGLLARKVIEEVLSDDVRFPARSDVAGSSDHNWSIKLQKAWPAFIMGASAMWLELINQHVEQREMKDIDIDYLLKHYRNVNESIREVWIQEGQHAFFHHLNAVFGYEPLFIRKMMKF